MRLILRLIEKQYLSVSACCRTLAMSLKNEFSALKLMGKRLGVCDNELSSSSVNLIEGVENQLARLH